MWFGYSVEPDEKDITTAQHRQIEDVTLNVWELYHCLFPAIINYTATIPSVSRRSLIFRCGDTKNHSPREDASEQSTQRKVSGFQCLET